MRPPFPSPSARERSDLPPTVTLREGAHRPPLLVTLWEGAQRPPLLVTLSEGGEADRVEGSVVRGPVGITGSVHAGLNDSPQILRLEPSGSARGLRRDEFQLCWRLRRDERGLALGDIVCGFRSHPV